MLELTNQELLSSGLALRKLMEVDLRGQDAFMLKRLAPEFDEEMKKLQSYRQELQEEYDPDTASEKWAETLSGTIELPGHRISEAELYDAEIDAQSLIQLDGWLIEPKDQSTSGGDAPDGAQTEAGNE